MPAFVRKKRTWLAAAFVVCVVWSCLTDTPPMEGSAADDVRAVAETRAAPVPYPAASEQLGRPTRSYPLDEILVYKKLPTYSQAPCLDAAVAKGKLPPVEERVPDEPQVLLASGMSEGLGEYGGVWRDVNASTTEGWNWGAGQSQGWYGINGILQEPLVKSGPIYLRSDKLEPLPNLAKDWTWSADGHKLTMRLIRGARWSDGHPFTTADVMFTWTDLILDPNVRHATSRTSWQIDGQNVDLRAIDEYTLEWTFPVAFPEQMLFQMDTLDFSVSPEHVLKRLHPTYNKSADYVSFENCLPPDKLPPVVLVPWVPVHYETDVLLVMRRNPYYWKVDESGKQLPYLDEVAFEKADVGLVRTRRTLAGAADHSNLENPSSFVETMRLLQDPDAHFCVEWGPETLGFSLLLNQSASLGVRTERDRALRTLFRDLRFRRAVSQAMYREGLCHMLVRGPFLRPWPGGLYPGSSYFDRESVVHYPYAPETSRALLQELGFRDTDDDGILNWTTGPLAGEPLSVLLITSGDASAGVALAQAMIPLLVRVGIRVNLRTLKATGMRAADETGVWEMRISRMGQEYAVPFSRAIDLAPIRKEAPVWHREGKDARALRPFEQELVRISHRLRRERNVAERKRMMADYNRIYTENVYTVGLVVGRYGLALAKRFRNIPVGAPAFLYQWTWNNVQADQVWVREEDRTNKMGESREVMPDMTPPYGGTAK